LDQICRGNSIGSNLKKIKIRKKKKKEKKEKKKKKKKKKNKEHKKTTTIAFFWSVFLLTQGMFIVNPRDLTVSRNAWNEVHVVSPK